MMTRLATLLTTALAAAILLSPQPAAAQTQTNVSAGADGIFPSGASFNGVSLNALEFGIGVTIAGDGSAAGDFQTTLLGISALGQPQEIVVEGKAGTGSRPASGTATFSGTCRVDMGDGTPAVTGVPCTATVTIAADGTETLTLLLDTTNLPEATVTTGSMTIQ